MFENQNVNGQFVFITMLLSEIAPATPNMFLDSLVRSTLPIILAGSYRRGVHCQDVVVAVLRETDIESDGRMIQSVHSLVEERPRERP